MGEGRLCSPEPLIPCAEKISVGLFLEKLVSLNLDLISLIISIHLINNSVNNVFRINIQFKIQI